MSEQQNKQIKEEDYKYEFNYEFQDNKQDEEYYSSDEDDYYVEDDMNSANFSNNYKPNQCAASKGVDNNMLQCSKQERNFKQQEMISKYQGKIKLQGTDMSHQVRNDIKQAQKSQNVTSKVKDKKDRATVEQVLDPRTRVILVKLLNNGMVSEIQGCISTGKEANVYYAQGPAGKEYAIKIYKTSILVFKDREKYVAGEFRFRRGHCKSNPRKMIKMWAEKEIRNLKRIHQSSIPCPDALIVKSNVLVMEFIGKDGKPAPRLRDAQVEGGVEEYGKIYMTLLKYMRELYHFCKLIHADLSEYNLLYYKQKLYMIDVSQSIEHDHPSGLEFLRRDILNINRYFENEGVLTFGLRQVFDFITKFNIENIQEELDSMIDNRKENSPEDEKIFAGMYIPRNLGEVGTIQAEKDIQKIMNQKNAQEVLYQNMTGLEIKAKNSENDDSEEDNEEEQNNDKKQQTTQKKVTINENNNNSEKIIKKDQNNDLKNPEKKRKDSSDSSSSSSSSSNSSSSDSDSSDSDSSDSDDDSDSDDESQDGEKKIKEKKKHGWNPYENMSKKERKQQVKQEKTEKRKEKIPKHLKKQLCNKNKKKK